LGWGNPTHHHQLYELLYALADQTDEPRYARAADEALAYFFQKTQHPKTGFVAWGEHLAWGLKSDAVVNSGAGVSKRDELTHEMKQWDLWPQVYRHAPYDRQDPGLGAEFPRYGGNMFVAWAHAYANAESDSTEREMVTAIETVAEGSTSIAAQPRGAFRSLGPVANGRAGGVGNIQEKVSCSWCGKQEKP
jgi:hypothetical protein